jgi:hypothetical protein
MFEFLNMIVPGGGGRGGGSNILRRQYLRKVGVAVKKFLAATYGQPLKNSTIWNKLLISHTVFLRTQYLSNLMFVKINVCRT